MLKAKCSYTLAKPEKTKSLFMIFIKFLFKFLDVYVSLKFLYFIYIFILYFEIKLTM